MPVSSKHINELLTNQEREKNTILFAKWPSDRLYYRVTLEKFDTTNKKASVHFEDGTVYDCPLAELHLQFIETDPYDAVDDVLCCVCEGEKSSKQNQIVICDTCQQGYHQKCHDPKIPSTLLQPELADDDWACATCDYMVDQIKIEVKSETVASTPRNVKKKPETQIKLPAPPKEKVVKEELSEPLKTKKQIQPKKDAKTRALVPLKGANAAEVAAQAKKLAKRDDCQAVPEHISALAGKFIDRDAKTIKTPDLIDSIASNPAAEAIKL